MHLCS